jgi:hypothetical protein
MILFPFAPHYGTGQNVAPTNTAASVSINATDKCVKLRNTGATNVCYVKIGTAAQITASPATTADMGLFPGETIIVYKGDGPDTLSHISAAGTTLTFMTGDNGS